MHLFFGLMDNYQFREKFLIRYEYIINNCFTTQNLLQQIEEFETRYQSEIERQINRWRPPLFTQRWHWEVDKMKVFARERPAIVMEQLKLL